MVDDVNDILIMRGEPRPRVHNDLIVVRRQQLVQLRVVQRALGLVVHKRRKHIASCFERLSVACGGRVALLLRADGGAAAMHVLTDGEPAGRYAFDHARPVDAGGRVGIDEPDAVTLEEMRLRGFGCVDGVNVDHDSECNRTGGDHRQHEQRDAHADHAKCSRGFSTSATVAFTHLLRDAAATIPSSLLSSNSNDAHAALRCKNMTGVSRL